MIPCSRSSGLPIRLLRGRTSTGASSAKPKIISTAPKPSVEAVALADPGSPSRPNASSASPAASTRAAATIRRLRTFPTPGVTASRIASTGSTRVARRAGTRPDTTVATMPTTRPAMIVRGSMTRPVLPRSRPKPCISARRPGASRTPPRMPSTDANAPMMMVSTITERNSCAREAPSVRSSANSRERCATVTENVLKIKKPPTSSATPAKTSSAVRMKPSASERSCACLSACSLPVRTVNSRPPSLLAIAALSSSGEVPPAAATEISS